MHMSSGQVGFKNTVSAPSCEHVQAFCSGLLHSTARKLHFLSSENIITWCSSQTGDKQHSSIPRHLPVEQQSTQTTLWMSGSAQGRARSLQTNTVTTSLQLSPTPAPRLLGLSGPLGRRCVRVLTWFRGRRWSRSVSFVTR